jgi:hypothetical protein
MECLKQFEINKIGLLNEHVKLPKKFYTCKWYIQKPYFTWNSFRPISCLIYIVNKYPIFNLNKMMLLNEDIGCFQHMFFKDMFKSCH